MFTLNKQLQKIVNHGILFEKQRISKYHEIQFQVYNEKGEKYYIGYFKLNNLFNSETSFSSNKKFENSMKVKTSRIGFFVLD